MADDVLGVPRGEPGWPEAAGSLAGWSPPSPEVTAACDPGTPAGDARRGRRPRSNDPVDDSVDSLGRTWGVFVDACGKTCEFRGLAATSTLRNCGATVHRLWRTDLCRRSRRSAVPGPAAVAFHHRARWPAGGHVDQDAPSSRACGYPGGPVSRAFRRGDRRRARLRAHHRLGAPRQTVRRRRPPQARTCPIPACRGRSHPGRRSPPRSAAGPGAPTRRPARTAAASVSWRQIGAASRSLRGRSSSPTRVAKVRSAGPPVARRRLIASASALACGSRLLRPSSTTVATQPSTRASSGLQPGKRGLLLRGVFRLEQRGARRAPRSALPDWPDRSAAWRPAARRRRP